MNIKCPHCGKLLLIKQQITDFSKIITCPVCKESSALSNFRIIEPANQPKSDHTQYGPQGGSTEIGGHGAGSQGSTTIGTVTVMGTGNEQHKLRLGKNIVGRAWEGNTRTDIQIPTPGKLRMSREHLVIEVKEVHGKGTVHYASLYKQQVNTTYVNDEQVSYNDCIILKDGDIIHLPDADLKFTIKNNQCDTILS